MSGQFGELPEPGVPLGAVLIMAREHAREIVSDLLADEYRDDPQGLLSHPFESEARNSDQANNYDVPRGYREDYYLAFAVQCARQAAYELANPPKEAT